MATAGERAVVLMTRLVEDDLDVLVQGGALPAAELQPGEHPAEGAWRALHAATGQDSVWWTCRKLGQIAGAGRVVHVFQSAFATAEEESPGPGWAWLPRAKACQCLSEDERAAVSMLSGR